MSNKIIGNVVGVPNPKSDWSQTDSKKSDFIKNKPTTLEGYGIKEEVKSLISASGGGSGSGLSEDLKTKYDTATLQAMYNEDIEPSPEHWFIFDEESKAIIALNHECSEYADSGITDLVFPFQINGMKVEKISTKPNYEVTLPSNIKNVRLPNCIKIIDEYAFEGNSSFKTINIPTSCMKIGNFAFHCCSSLETVITPIKPNYELDIEPCVFSGCEALNNVDTIIDGIKVISSGCFVSTSIEHIIIPESVDSIESDAFNPQMHLKTATILNPNCQISSGAFEGLYGTSDIFTIKGYKGSTAETYANAKGIKFIALDEAGGSGDVDLSDCIKVPETAEIGQTIVVKEVDENGKPTLWESADFPSGAKKWDLLGEYTFSEDSPVSAVTLRDLPNYTEFTIYIRNLNVSIASADLSVYVNGKRVVGGGISNGLYSVMHLYLCDRWLGERTSTRTSEAMGVTLETSSYPASDNNPATRLVIKNMYDTATLTKGTMVIYGGK